MEIRIINKKQQERKYLTIEEKAFWRLNKVFGCSVEDIATAYGEAVDEVEFKIASATIVILQNSIRTKRWINEVIANNRHDTNGLNHSVTGVNNQILKFYEGDVAHSLLDYAAEHFGEALAWLNRRDDTIQNAYAIALKDLKEYEAGIARDLLQVKRTISEPASYKQFYQMRKSWDKIDAQLLAKCTNLVDTPTMNKFQDRFTKSSRDYGLSQFLSELGFDIILHIHD